VHQQNESIHPKIACHRPGSCRNVILNNWCHSTVTSSWVGTCLDSMGLGSHTEDTCYSCYTVTTEALSSFPESFSTSRHSKVAWMPNSRDPLHKWGFCLKKGHEESNNKQM
jgi:hypothetical protein